MKRLEIFLASFCLTALMLFTPSLIHAAEQAELMDSVEIGLITCSPHEEVYSLYGHSAIRYRELNTGRDFTFNYGVFDFKAPHFISRFVFGKTDYELGVIPTDLFCKYYKSWGSQVTEQVLNLTNEEKAQIKLALSINLQPENRIYRYNFFYDNCSTRPRDIIANNLNGEIIYEQRTDFTPSFREMIHQLTARHPWAAMGNDLLLGVKADLKTSRSEQEFLPMNLLYDFDHAQIYSHDGNYKPLVKERRTLVPAGVQMVKKEFPLSPTEVAILLLLIFICIFLLEWKRKSCIIWIDLPVMLIYGLAGCIILLMFFSEHPTTSTNLQVLLFNPLPLFFIPSVLRKKPATRYWQATIVLIAMFFVGGIWQDYAEGTEILALCLLSRCMSHIRNDK